MQVKSGTILAGISAWHRLARVVRAESFTTLSRPNVLNGMLVSSALGILGHTWGASKDAWRSAHVFRTTGDVVMDGTADWFWLAAESPRGPPDEFLRPDIVND